MERENTIDFTYYRQRAINCSDYRKIEEEYMDGYVLKELDKIIAEFLKKHKRDYYIGEIFCNPRNLRKPSRRLFH